MKSSHVKDQLALRRKLYDAQPMNAKESTTRPGSLNARKTGGTRVKNR